MTLDEVKRSNIIKFRLPYQFQRFSYQTVCVFSQKKNIEQNVHSIAGVMPQGRDLGVLGVKTLAWVFAMAPHRLRILALIFFFWKGSF